MKNTKQVEGRRELNYLDFNEVVADIERVVAGPHRTLGNWTAAENIDHVAKPIRWAIDGYPDDLKIPLLFKLVGPLMKKSFLKRQAPPPGIKPPSKMMAAFEPEAGVDLDTALGRLRDAVTRWPECTPVPKNPMVGSMTKAQWERFLTNHASLHFSFIVPEAAESTAG